MIIEYVAFGSKARHSGVFVAVKGLHVLVKTNEHNQHALLSRSSFVDPRQYDALIEPVKNTLTDEDGDPVF